MLQWNEITNLEIFEMIKNLHPDKAAGEDEIPSFAIKEGRIYIIPFLKSIYNKVWKTGEYTTKWNTGIIIPIPKTREEFPTTEDTRPITLLSHISKGMEKIVLKKIQELNRRSQIIFRNHNVFHEGRSTMECLTILHSKAHKAITERKVLAVCFLNLTKAYDKVDRKILIK